MVGVSAEMEVMVYDYTNVLTDIKSLVGDMSEYTRMFCFA